MTLAQAYRQQFGEVSYPFEICDTNGNETYHETRYGYWQRREYDSKGKQTYYENSYGYWSQREYDTNGNETYFEDSYGRIEDQRQTIEIDGVKYSTEQVRERIAELKPTKDK